MSVRVLVMFFGLLFLVGCIAGEETTDGDLDFDSPDMEGYTPPEPLILAETIECGADKTCANSIIDVYLSSCDAVMLEVIHDEGVVLYTYSGIIDDVCYFNIETDGVDGKSSLSCSFPKDKLDMTLGTLMIVNRVEYCEEVISLE